MAQWTPDEARQRVRAGCAILGLDTMRVLAAAYRKEAETLAARGALALVMADEYDACAKEAEAARLGGGVEQLTLGAGGGKAGASGR